MLLESLTARVAVAKARIESFLGPLWIINLEVAAIFLVAVSDFLFFGSKYHFISAGIVLGIVAVTFLSVYVTSKRVKKKETEILIDDLADDLANRITEILQVAIADKWPTADEDELCKIERQSGIKETWVLGADLSPDLGCRRGIILDNFSEGKKYRYLCPHDEHTWKQLHKLFHTCQSNVRGFRDDQLEMRSASEGESCPQCSSWSSSLPSQSISFFRGLPKTAVS